MRKKSVRCVLALALTSAQNDCQSPSTRASSVDRRSAKTLGEANGSANGTAATSNAGTGTAKLDDNDDAPPTFTAGDWQVLHSLSPSVLPNALPDASNAYADDALT